MESMHIKNYALTAGADVCGIADIDLKMHRKALAQRMYSVNVKAWLYSSSKCQQR